MPNDRSSYVPMATWQPRIHCIVNSSAVRQNSANTHITKSINCKTVPTWTTVLPGKSNTLSHATELARAVGVVSKITKSEGMLVK